MRDLFLSVLHMSILGIYSILIVSFIRLFIRKFPKTCSYVLWIIVFFRLLCPVSIEGMFSLLPSQVTSIDFDNVLQETQGINSTQSQEPIKNSGIEVLEKENKKEQNFYSKKYKKIDFLSVLWIIGSLSLGIYQIIATIKLRIKLKDARKLEKNIYEVENIGTSFVFGVFIPKIYLPVPLTDDQKKYILLHERVHIKRKDYLIKLIAFFALWIHWFNPFVWLAFFLMERDMELSCDEMVIKTFKIEEKKQYSLSLLTFSEKKYFSSGYPLAFGEDDIKKRIKNILSYKKPVLGIILFSIFLVGIIGIGLLSNPVKEKLPTSPYINEFLFSTITNPPNSNKSPDINTDSTELIPEEAYWEADMPLGADGPELDFANDDFIIFHDYFGLFVYDLKQFKLVRSLNLEKIGCNMTQGDNYCEVSVSEDGTIVYLHPLQKEDMYLYMVNTNKLKKEAYDKSVFKIKEYPGKLVYGSEMIWDLGYQIEDMIFLLFPTPVLETEAKKIFSIEREKIKEIQIIDEGGKEIQKIEEKEKIQEFIEKLNDSIWHQGGTREKENSEYFCEIKFIDLSGTQDVEEPIYVQSDNKIIYAGYVWRLQEEKE